MGEINQPPLPPKNIDITDYKKLWSAEVADFLHDLTVFAKETGVWSVIVNALNDESIFHNISKRQVDAPEQVISENHVGQGLVLTGYEGQDGDGKDLINPNLEVIDVREIYPDLEKQTLQAWLFHLSIFNHPQYLDNLFERAENPFEAPKRKFNLIMWWAKLTKQALSIHDLTLAISPADQPRLSRTQIFTSAPMVSYWTKKNEQELGNKQARNMFVAGENADVTGSPMMLATMAASHHLVGISRDGVFADIDRQVELAKGGLELVGEIAKLFGRSEEEREKLRDWYSRNLIGVVESRPDTALIRAKALYEQGIRTFRVYSPEPNQNLVETVSALRKFAKDSNWEEIEIFAGQVISVKQAILLEEAGANAIYLGVGGGGRCTTGKVANLAIDWPQLLWDLRGKISIPVIVQGGANDNPITATVLGASGLGIVGKLAASVESPGGYLYFYDPATGEIFNFYGGEASNRQRAMADRVDPMGRTINTEGETTKKDLIYSPDNGLFPTSLQRLTELIEALSTGFVFQNTKTIKALQKNGPKNLRRESPYMSQSRGEH